MTEEHRTELLQRLADTEEKLHDHCETPAIWGKEKTLRAVHLLVELAHVTAGGLQALLLADSIKAEKEGSMKLNMSNKDPSQRRWFEDHANVKRLGEWLSYNCSWTGEGIHKYYSASWKYTDEWEKMLAEEKELAEKGKLE